MRPIRLLTSLAIFAATAAGCAAISGLDQLEKIDCTVDCEAGGATNDATNDVTIGDARNDIGMNDVAVDSTDLDAGIDTGVDSATDSATDARDGAVDAPGDSPADAPPDAPPVDGGCGPTNTATNCGACGNACNTTTNTVRACGGGTSCLYTCNSGRADCNAATAPNLDGCECATTTCCGTACQTQHDNGLGNTFYDCVASGTYNVAQATEACVAFTNDAAQCNANFFCTAGADGGVIAQLVCSDTSPTACACWTYSGVAVGHVANSGLTGPLNCQCPQTSHPMWH